MFPNRGSSGRPYPPELVLGCVQLGLAYGIANQRGKPTGAAAFRLLRRAADAGIRCFDTARAYGDSEDRLGKALRERHVRIITKLSPLTELTPDSSCAKVVESVDESINQSLLALRASALDCLLLHRADHLTAFNGLIWQRLAEHLSRGQIRMLGVSVQSPEEAFLALKQPMVRHIQVPFNLLDWRWREAGVISAFIDRPDVTLHARSVFLQGSIAAENPSTWPHVPGVDAGSLASWLANTVRSYGRTSAADLALAFVRGQKWLNGIVVGMETGEQLEINLALFERPPLASADCEAIERTRPRAPPQLLDPGLWPKDRRAEPRADGAVPEMPEMKSKHQP